jgi:DNA-binding NarL/FixJ family response regulator
MEKPRLILADDHQLLVDGIRKLLEPEFNLIETVADGRSAVEAYHRLKPDLVLLDIGLPLLNGIEVARQIRRASPGAKILFVTMQTDRIYVEEAFRAGGSGYLLKQAAARELVDAIRAVLTGRFYISKLIASKMENLPVDTLKNPVEHFGGRLTQRQREVLQLIAEGKPMKEIADILHISVRTVEFHKNGIMRELGLNSTAELTRYAMEHGIATV